MVERIDAFPFAIDARRNDVAPGSCEQPPGPQTLQCNVLLDVLYSLEVDVLVKDMS